MKRSLWKLLAVLLALTLVAAACGNDDDDVADEPAPAPATEAPTAAPTEAPAPQPTEAPAPQPTEEMAPELPKITVGYLQWIYADEAGKRIEDAAQEAVEFLGWGYETCDANGDPAQMPVCGNQLLDSDIDVMLTDGIPEAFITDVLERAAAEGIPVLSAGGEVDPRNFYIASFASDDTDLGVQLANYLVEQFPNGARIIVQEVPTAWSDKRITGLNSVIEGADIEIVDKWEGDFANLVAGTEADVTTKLQQFENIDAVWINFSVASIGAASAIGALYPDGDDPDRPLLVTFYANPTTVNDIRSGRVDAAVDEKLEWQSWAQVNAVAELLAFGTEPSQDRAPDYDGRNFSVRQVVTIDTVNAMSADSTEVPAPDPPGDYEEYFRNKWCGQFSRVANCG